MPLVSEIAKGNISPDIAALFEQRAPALAGNRRARQPNGLPSDGSLPRAFYGAGLVGGIDEIARSGPGIAGRKTKK